MSRFNNPNATPEQMNAAMVKALDEEQGLQNLNMEKLYQDFKGGAEMPQARPAPVQPHLMPRKSTLSSKGAQHPELLGQVLANVDARNKIQQNNQLEEAEQALEFAPENPEVQERLAKLRRTFGK